MDVIYEIVSENTVEMRERLCTIAKKKVFPNIYTFGIGWNSLNKIITILLFVSIFL